MPRNARKRFPRAWIAAVVAVALGLLIGILSVSDIRSFRADEPRRVLPEIPAVEPPTAYSRADHEEGYNRAILLRAGSEADCAALEPRHRSGCRSYLQDQESRPREEGLVNLN